MIVHVSLYKLHDPARAAEMEALLGRAAEEEPSIRTSWVGRNVGAPPPMEEGPAFGDVGQVITFDTPEEAAAYPAGEGHRRLVEASGGLVAQAWVIDFPV